MRSDWLCDLPANLLVGTSSFSSDDWSGVFYPVDLPAGERIGYYSTQFPTVEIDSSFYGMPSPGMVAGWKSKTPDGFVFALKVPREITHDRELDQVDAATAAFVDVTGGLGERRGPLLLQFAYVAKGRDAVEYETGQRFLDRLAGWLDRWAGAADWVVEVRNSKWLDRPLLGLLREHAVPLALTAYYTMPSLGRLQALELDPLTGPFAYVRFLGDHRRIDEKIEHLIASGRKSRRYDELVEDREHELRGWVDSLLPVLARMRTFAFFNNHFAGFGPGSARMFAELWREIHGLGQE